MHKELILVAHESCTGGAVSVRSSAAFEKAYGMHIRQDHLHAHAIFFLVFCMHREVQ